MKVQKANRTHTRPPAVEVLGDGTYYYNFSIIESEVSLDSTDGVYGSFDYTQIRLSLPINENEIQEALNQLNISHNVNI